MVPLGQVDDPPKGSPSWGEAWSPPSGGRGGGWGSLLERRGSDDGLMTPPQPQINSFLFHSLVFTGVFLPAIFPLCFLDL